MQEFLRLGVAQTGAVVDASREPRVEKVLQALPEIEEESKKLRAIIPSQDVPLLEACLFLRMEFKQGHPVEEYKSEIVRMFGTRGRNFANLCSAGYLEDWFEPLYDELMRANPNNPAEAMTQFQKLYNTIVNELPWTEFVSSWGSVTNVTAHIVEKMKRNIANGVRFLNVHGLGENNVKKVSRILPEIQKQTGADAVRVDKDPNRIFVRLEIPPQV